MQYFSKNNRCSLFQNEKEYYIYYEIPGVAKENLDIFLEGNRLIIKTNQQKTSEHSSDQLIYQGFAEKLSGHKVFQLNNQIDTDSIHASLSNGILEIKLHKLEEHQTKKIAIA